MKKIFIILSFFILAFITNIDKVKAYWEVEEYMSNEEAFCKGMGYNYLEVSYWPTDVGIGSTYLSTTFCYKNPKSVSGKDKLLNKCTVPQKFEDINTYPNRYVGGKDMGCPDGYFSIITGSTAPIAFSKTYKEKCIPCANYSTIVGSKRKNANGETCYLTSNKKEACPSGFTTFPLQNGTIDWNKRDFYCWQSVTGSGGGYPYPIVETGTGFGNTMTTPSWLKDPADNKVCPDGYMMVNNNCYECRTGEPGGNGDVDCSVFIDITGPIWTAIRIIAPILAVVLGALDFLRATAASDEKEMKKATNNFVKRLIMLALLFLLTFIINFIVGLIGFGSVDACIK